MSIDGVYLLGLNNSEKKRYVEEVQSSAIIMPNISSHSDEWTETDGPGWIMKTVAKPKKLGISLPGFAPQTYMRVRHVDSLLCIIEEGAVKGAPAAPARTRFSPGKPLLPSSVRAGATVTWTFDQSSHDLNTTHEVSLTVRGTLESKAGTLWWIHRAVEEEGGLHQSDEFYLPGVGEFARSTRSSLTIGKISGLKRLMTPPGPVDEETVLAWLSEKVAVKQS